LWSESSCTGLQEWWTFSRSMGRVGTQLVWIFYSEQLQLWMTQRPSSFACFLMNEPPNYVVCILVLKNHIMSSAGD
jgi:hypothetical protein